jgi:uncharacterized protein
MSTTFTPISSLLGGILIGVAAALMLLACGRIAGISGILGGLTRPTRGDVAWRLTFVLGLVVGGLVIERLRPGSLGVSVAPLWLVAVAGLLVGYGSRLGHGCTSGHGLCGISRLSRRSIVATLVFMGAGAATVFVLRHLVGGVA